ncbi:MAG: hypothetical protein ACLP8S_18045 [Solirubrobacteraceae bacterium]
MKSVLEKTVIRLHLMWSLPSSQIDPSDKATLWGCGDKRTWWASDV